MKIKLSRKGMATMLALTIPCMALAVQQESKATELTSRESRMLATASLLALISPTNCTAVTNIMTDEARHQWQDALKQLCLDGTQMFLPDFCKVKYTMIGGYDDRGFVMGLYNPFYDGFMVFMVEDVDHARISGFRLVSRASLSGNTPGRELPKSCGVTPAVDYFPTLLEQIKSAREIFKSTLLNSGFRSAFAEITLGIPSDISALRQIMEFRTAMAIMIAQDKRTLRDAALALAVVRDGCGAKSDLVSTDASTRLTLKTLCDNLAPARSSLSIVASFVAGGANNILLATPRVPTLLVLVHVENDARIWLRMFDAHSVDIQLMR